MRKNALLLLLLLLLLSLPAILWAATVTNYSCDPSSSFCNPVPVTDQPISILVGKIIKAVLGIIGSIALILFILAGFTWLTAKGNSQQIKKATDIMIWAAIGLAVVFSSYTLLNFVFDVIH